MPRRDFTAAIALIALGAFISIESIRMPRMEEFGLGAYAAPGVLPGFLGCVLAILGTAMLVRAARAGGWKLFPSARPAGRHALPPGTVSLAITLVLVLIYSAVLVGLIPFWLATFLFVFAFVAFFEWEPGLTRARRIRALGIACALAIAAAVAVTWLFERMFRIHLP